MEKYNIHAGKNRINKKWQVGEMYVIYQAYRHI
jgi:hypothetical protein